MKCNCSKMAKYEGARSDKDAVCDFCAGKQHGMTTMEYALIVVGVSLAFIAAFFAFREDFAALFGKVAGQ